MPFQGEKVAKIVSCYKMFYILESTLNYVNEKSFIIKNSFLNYYMTITSILFNKMD